jgi:hypothetical protein
MLPAAMLSKEGSEKPDSIIDQPASKDADEGLHQNEQRFRDQQGKSPHLEGVEN